MILSKKCLSVIDQHAPGVKTKCVRENQAPFMNKELSKAIMRRSKLRKVHKKLKTKESWKAFLK